MVYKDSAKFWFPRINTLDMKVLLANVNIPQTVFVDYNEAEIFDAANIGYGVPYSKLFVAVELAIRYDSKTAFIRTDVTSAKHLGLNAIKVSPTNNLHFALRQTLKHAEEKTYLSKYKSSAIMVRSWIDIPGATAFKGLPIGHEWRIFAGPRGIYCANPYWPKEALEGFMDNSAAIPEPPQLAPAHLRTAAYIAALAMDGGIWSVDFVEDIHGKFWLIDMARGENSYHNEHCECGLDNLFAE